MPYSLPKKVGCGDLSQVIEKQYIGVCFSNQNHQDTVQSYLCLSDGFCKARSNQYQESSQPICFKITIVLKRDTDCL